MKPDIAEMVSWIVRIEGGSSAELLDPVLRGPVLARYKKYEKEIELLRKAEAQARKLQE